MDKRMTKIKEDWLRDVVHDRSDDSLLYLPLLKYKFPEGGGSVARSAMGRYIWIHTDKIEYGIYFDAVPTIGDAHFKPVRIMAVVDPWSRLQWAVEQVNKYSFNDLVTKTETNPSLHSERGEVKCRRMLRPVIESSVTEVFSDQTQVQSILEKVSGGVRIANERPKGYGAVIGDYVTGTEKAILFRSGPQIKWFPKSLLVLMSNSLSKQFGKGVRGYSFFAPMWLLKKNGF